MRHCAVVILCTFVVFVQSAVVWRDVEITQGTVRGHLDPNGGLFVFYNVPYATAPIGPEKFKVNETYVLTLLLLTATGTTNGITNGTT